MSNEYKEHYTDNWSEYRKLVLMSLEDSDGRIKLLEDKLHALDLRINTLETKLWAGLGILGVLVTIVSPVISSYFNK